MGERGLYRNVKCVFDQLLGSLEGSAFAQHVCFACLIYFVADHLQLGRICMLKTPHGT